MHISATGATENEFAVLYGKGSADPEIISGSPKFEAGAPADGNIGIDSSTGIRRIRNRLGESFNCVVKVERFA